MKLITVKSEQNVIEELCKLVESSAKESISRSGSFRIGLSGGSLIKYLAHGLPSINTDWAKWQLFFCDERYVPETDLDSTFGNYNDLLVNKIEHLSAAQFVKINVDLELNACARDYEQQIRSSFGMPEVSHSVYLSINQTSNMISFHFYFQGIPEFDLLLLGMGPDGHTCSLFPGHGLLNETSCLIAPISDSPKPPPCRVTMTYPLINRARCCVFAMAGQGKADMIKRIIKEKEDLPAGRVKPENGNLYWIIDEAAAGLMQQ